MNNECAEVDKLILELADYKNDLGDMAAEKLFRKCSTSWEPINICKIGGTMPGYPTVRVSSLEG